MRGHLIQGPSLACHFGDLEGAFPSSACPFAGLPLQTLPPLDVPPTSPYGHPHLQNVLPWMDVPSATWIGTGISSQLVQPRGGETVPPHGNILAWPLPLHAVPPVTSDLTHPNNIP